MDVLQYEGTAPSPQRLSRSSSENTDKHVLAFQADLAAARDAEVEAKRRLVEEAESAARQAAAQIDTAAQLDRVQVAAGMSRGRLCASAIS